MLETIPCRCLLKDSGQEDMSRLVAEYIALLPEDQRAPEEIYRQRLTRCEACDALRNGTCARCGCYVEARAAKRRMGCPEVPAKWEAAP